MGKKSNQYVDRHVWKAAQYLLLSIYYSIGISLRSSDAATPTGSSHPLTYSIVQAGENGGKVIDLFTDNGTVELNADQQEFDNINQIINAKGKVLLRFNQAVLNADKLRVNLITKIAVAEGNVSLVRGRQILYGTRFEYNFGSDQGVVTQARGDIYQPTLTNDLNVKPNTTVGNIPFPEPLLSDRLRYKRPLRNVQSIGSAGVIVGSDRDIDYQPSLKPLSSTINRLRFQADKISFVGDRISANGIRITNDPFSPPEIQIQADRAEFKTLNPEENEVSASNLRITLDDKFSIPIPKDTLVWNTIGKDPNPFGIGYDGGERGGLYLENNFYPIFNRQFKLTVTPQYYLQRAISGLKLFDSSVFGVKANLQATLSPKTSLEASTAITGLTPESFSNTFRGRAVIKQNLNLFDYPHLLSGEAVYRDRVFNGSLGYQEIQSSIGVALASPNIPLDDISADLDYQVGIHKIIANTDRPNLLAANRTNDLTSINRYQTSINLNKSFRLWDGNSLPINQKQTYNYSPTPVVPYLQLNTGIQAALNIYGIGDVQSSLGYSIGIQGQIGNFSKSSFDYTGFNLGYFHKFSSGSSPFLFDRLVDNRVLSAGISQQISGPFRLGIQSSVNLDSGQQISTDYYLEYSRRTYNLILRYNPTLQLGTINFRLNDFSWDGVPPKI